MEYKTPQEARELPGLRIALTTGLPAPWSMAARFMFDVKGVDYVPVAQLAGQANEELVAWTGHRNAPVAMYKDEPARTNWADIIELAERLQPEPRLVPVDVEQRIRMFGLCNEICGAGGLLWTARHLMIAPALQAGGEIAASAGTMANAYGYSEAAVAAAPQRIAQVLDTLRRQLETQRGGGCHYFIGDSLSALDLVWASFSNTLRPLPDDVNPMDQTMRKVYSRMEDAFKPAEILFEHRDFIYRSHLTLPLDF